MVGQLLPKRAYRSGTNIFLGLTQLLGGLFLFGLTLADTRGSEPGGVVSALVLGSVLLVLGFGNLRRQLILSDEEVVDRGMFTTRRFSWAEIGNVLVETYWSAYDGGWLHSLAIVDQAGKTTPLKGIGSWRRQHAESIAEELKEGGRRVRRPAPSQAPWAPTSRPWRDASSTGQLRRP